MTIQEPMLMCGKVANKNLIGSNPLFQKVTTRQISVNMLTCLFL